MHGSVCRAPRERAAMLLAHGYGEHLGRYVELTDALLGLGVSVLAYDQRGHGRSPGRRATVDVETLVRDHLAVRRQAAALTTGRDLLLHGHSLGGVVVAASVLRRPAGVPAVLLSSPALDLGVPTVAPVRAAATALARVAPRAPTVRLDARAVSRVPSVVADYEADPLVAHVRLPALTAATLLTMGAEVLTRAERWAPPVLLVHGTHDRLAMVEGSRRFAREAGTARRPRPPVRLVEVPGGFHELFHDLDAAAMLDVTVDWVRGRLG
ncbi:alpha/beta fold hydrolase [Georgenia sp. 10Sc9-8]|uniref:Alpha/beta fold hydrolase n=1 Tax=Georgenia halotolerans TaxID=3028317 RepID=A0ABT5TYL5_9MICO|nr:alpha/beta fold hydrolase [Georgenia halotolerans]